MRSLILAAVALALAAGTADAQSRYLPGGNGGPTAPRLACAVGVLDVRSVTDDGAPLWSPQVWFYPIGYRGRLGTPVLLTFDDLGDYVEAIHADGHTAHIRGRAVSPTVFRVSAILISE